MSDRKVSDCRNLPSEKNCTVTIAGKEEEVIPLAVYHAVHDHGEMDTPKLRQEIIQTLEDEEE